MKNFIFLLFVFLAAMQVSGKKKDKIDAKDAKIDSLSRAIDSLRINCDSLAAMNRTHYDSVSTELNEIYIVIRERVVKREFDMARLPSMIDSIITKIEAGTTGLHTNSATLMDSLAVMQKENIRMKTLLENLTNDESGKNRLFYELKELKGMLDTNILTQAEFDLMKAKLLVKWQ